jgi:2-phospho-L-lactate transferase/gluconeogenesis factor (CofD/UPF0052 family)
MKSLSAARWLANNYKYGQQLLRLGKQHLSDNQRGTHTLRGTLPTTKSQAELVQGFRNTLKRLTRVANVKSDG